MLLHMYLEMLDTSENESKQEKYLIQWVDNMTGTASSRKQFLASRHISAVYLNHGGEEEGKKHRLPFSKAFLQFDVSR